MSTPVQTNQKEAPMNIGQVIQVPAGSALEQVADPDVDVEEEGILRAEAERVRREVARLPKLERQVIEMSYGLNGYGRALTTREICDLLQMPMGTCHRTREGGLERLRCFYGLTTDPPAEETAD